MNKIPSNKNWSHKMKQGKLKLFIGLFAAVISMSLISCFDDSSGLKTFPGSSGDKEPNTDSYLEYLNLAEVDISPVFHSNVTSYEAIIDYVATDDSTLDVTAVGIEYATVTIDGVEVNSLNDYTTTVSVNDNLNDDPMVNTQDIAVEVTSEDGITTKTYTITVKMDYPPSTNNNLASLELAAYSGSTGVTPVTWSPDPGTELPGTQTYAASVPYNTTKVEITATVEDSESVMNIDGTSVDSGTAYEVTISSSPQDIVVEVISESNSSKTYTVTVTLGAAPSDESRLASLGLTSGGTWSSEFDPNTTSYTVEYSDVIPDEMNSIDVTPTAMDSNATITVDGTTVSSGSTSTVTLSSDPQSIIIDVESDDMSSTTTYVITVEGGSSGCGG
jgi:uncharacterized lipoprotein YehR (DUF1307 family)